MTKHVFGEKSSSIHSCDFEDESNTLKIQFCSSNKIHEYQNCTREIYEGLRKAESPGKYFHSTIRNQFKVKP